MLAPLVWPVPVGAPCGDAVCEGATGVPGCVTVPGVRKPGATPWGAAEPACATVKEETRMVRSLPVNRVFDNAVPSPPG